MSASWFAADPDAHRAFVELAEFRRRVEPWWRWDRLHALQDLRYFEGEAREHAANRRTGRRFPSRTELAERWGWGEHQVRELLKTDWHDPDRPVPYAVLRPLRARKEGA